MDARSGVRSDQFFRARLLKISDVQELRGLIGSYRAETRELIEQIYNIVWNMRGMSREEAWALSHEERKIIMRQIDDRVKMVEKTGLAIL